MCPQEAAGDHDPQVSAATPRVQVILRHADPRHRVPEDDPGPGVLASDRVFPLGGWK